MHKELICFWSFQLLAVQTTSFLSICGIRSTKHNVIFAFSSLHQWHPFSKSISIRSNHLPKRARPLESEIYWYHIHQLWNTTDTLLSVVHDKMRREHLRTADGGGKKGMQFGHQSSLKWPGHVLSESEWWMGPWANLHLRAFLSSKILLKCLL